MTNHDLRPKLLSLLTVLAAPACGPAAIDDGPDQAAETGEEPAEARSTAEGDFAGDLREDWADGINPNGPWSLMKNETEVFDTLQLDYWADGTGQHAWADDPFQENAHVPVWMQVTNGTSELSPGYWEENTQPGDILLHGAEASRTGTNRTGVVFAVPMACTVRVDGDLWQNAASDHGTRSFTWSIRVNDSVVSSKTFLWDETYTRQHRFRFADGDGGADALSLDVDKGDTISVWFERAASSPGTFVGLNFSVVCQ